MIGGQMLDIVAEGRFDEAGTLPSAHGEGAVALMQRMKTGALIRFACRAGGILGACSPSEAAAIGRYGQAIGEAFQIADDLLDIEGDAGRLGKAVGKDAAAGKATLVALLGAEGARGRLRERLGEAQAALDHFGTRAAMLAEAARFIGGRNL
jgi:farnesyl diphosphate synthase